ncbi:DUF1877 family protein [Streptomyces decoyicus]
MGQDIQFVRVTAAELERAEQEPDWADELVVERSEEGEEDDDLVGFLGRDWAGLQYLFDAAEVPVMILDGGSTIDEQGIYTGWDVESVEHVAGVLRKVDWEDLAGHYDPQQMLEEDVYPGHGYWDRDGNGLGYLEGAFVTLRHIFTTAAAAGSAAIREFNF